MNSVNMIGRVTPILMDWDEAEDSTPELFEKRSRGQAQESDRARVQAEKGGFTGADDGSGEEDILEFAAGVANQTTTRRVLAAALLDSELRRRLFALRVAADHPFQEATPDGAAVQALYDSLLTLTWDTAHGLLTASRPRKIWTNSVSS